MINLVSINRVIYSLIFTVIFLCLNSCKSDVNESAINNSLSRVEKVQEMIESIPMDSISNVITRLNKAKEEIRWLGLDSNVVFIREDAVVVELLANASRCLKDAPKRMAGIVNEISRCKTQLISLKEVISSGANRDVNGDTIDSKYLEMNTTIEIKAVNNLEEIVNETLSLIRLGLVTDSAGWKSIDSLITVKKGQWARSIAER